MKKVGSVISLKGKVLIIRANILGTLILNEKGTANLFRLDGCVLKEI